MNQENLFLCPGLVFRHENGRYCGRLFVTEYILRSSASIRYLDTQGTSIISTARLRNSESCLLIGQNYKLKVGNE